MRELAVERLELEGALRRGLVRDEFRVYYQPVIRFDSSEVIGFEALVRWEHPERGLLAPDDFLAVAEETGLIVPIGAWVLREACAQAASWAEEPSYDIPLVVSVNVSARQLADDDLIPTVRAALASLGSRSEPAGARDHRDDAHGRPRSRSTFSARSPSSACTSGSTTSVPASRRSRTCGRCRCTRSRSTARSSTGWAAIPKGAAIVSAVVHLGHALGLSVTAEGVETTGQLSELRALGCDLGQGFYFAYPQPGPIVQALVRHRFQWRQRETVS